MKIEHVIRHYGSELKAADALGKTAQCIATWRKNGKIPIWSQWAIQAKSDGKLKADKK